MGKTIDTPGEYVERKRFYQALLVTSADADCILMLQGCDGWAVRLFSRNVRHVSETADWCGDKN